MKYIKLLSLLGLFSILLISCSKKSKLGKMIPKEAAVVIDINTKSLLSKLSRDEIKQTYWYNHLMNDNSVPATSKIFMEDPVKTGIDLESDIVFFILNPDNNGQSVTEGAIKNSKLFSDFLKSIIPTGVINRAGELNIFKTDSAIIGWNDEKFAFVSNFNYQKLRGIDTLNDSTIAPLPITLLSSDSLLSICKNLFSLNDDNSLYKNEKFAELENEEGDVHVWVNNDAMAKNAMQNMPGMAGMIKLDKFLEGNISTATINFRDGKVTINQKQYFGKELSDILKKGDGDMNTDMIKRLPSQNLAVVFCMHFTPGSILEIIRLTGLDGFINIFLSAQGLSLDDAIKATKGDIIFAVSDVIPKIDSVQRDTVYGMARDYSKFSQQPSAKFLFAVAIGDKDAFNKLISIGKKIGKDMTQKNTFSKMDDKYFAVSNSQDAINKYFSGTLSDPAFLSQIKDHPAGGFIDIQIILKALQSEFTKDSIGTAHYNRNIAIWNNIYFKGGDYRDGGLVNYTELNLVDKTINSLKQINRYIDENAKIIIEKKNKQKEELKKDSLKTRTDSIVIKRSRSKKRK